ncbi:MAG TPA: AAA family ATPase [Sedimentisphaerales bacterium]|nr:AAA family ATPase [Sedimentisphaerales bacterium]
MKLKAFRIKNYKKIRDTKWTDCEDLTVFVGKNESGKTALFKALSKLKPTDGAKYDPIKEFPHSRYTDEFKKQDWPVASGKFSLMDDEVQQLSNICKCLNKTDGVIVTRYYSDKVEVDFEPPPKIPTVTNEEWIQFLSNRKKGIEDSVAPNGQGAKWQPLKDNLSQFLSREIVNAQKQNFNLSQELINTVRQQITSSMNEQWMKDILQLVVDELNEINSAVSEAKAIDKAKKWVTDSIPYFLYFGNYEVLTSDIYFPEFLRRLGQNDKSPKTRVQAAIFKHVGADIKELANLGRHNQGQIPNEDVNIRRQIDELDIKANAASIAMTRKFSDWWEQRRHKFTYKFHGDYFRVWISDDLDPSDVELEERSLGLQYFFSFYLLFLVEAEEEHRDCILLLDEPGLHLHGTAQEKLIRFLEKISQKNQTLYTTHSPFMIDGGHLERARAVYETSEGTLISSDVWPKDRDTLFPLQAALGYSVYQSLFLSKRQIMIEGQNDYLLLCALNQHLITKGKGLRDDIVMIPMGGATNLCPLASMLIGHDIEIAILLDSDPAGLGAMKKIRNLLADVDKRCFIVSQFSGDNSVKEMEDLIPKKYYLDAFTRAYPEVTLEFSSEEMKIANIVDRITAFFDHQNLGKFEKWKLIQQIVQDINKNDTKVPRELYDTAALIFEKFNTAFTGK